MTEHGRIVAEVSAVIGEARPTLARAASGVRTLLDAEAWREFTGPGGELVEHGDLVEFITSDPPRGLGVTPGLVRALVADDLDVAAQLDQALLADTPTRPEEPEEPEELEEAHVPAPETPALRRLREDAPALHSKVVAGELSTNAAMVQAGFRPRTISVPVSRPENAAKALRRNLSREELVELVSLLSQDL
ncbi:hypothetical protein [Nonomuraea endophytica]|uniref:Uncharacterized protein n=1 Tax=Nonomuraea endophytica TaxID=714136 RepID=A0A7W8A5P4_9ACTN|nr:hypothetical protein [Nonomuraea endophytica]MBB5079161.1 hypothetical protein [Nonomuraea endophytica]